ncbi:MAG: hypothetical protein ACP5F1_03230 [Thermoplasmata archaeon]|nr:hypothetical protein [Thermoplasmata archaeon]
MKENTKVILRYISYPIAILLALVFAPLPLWFRGIFPYFQVMPLIIFFSGIFLMVIGSFWDFGARIYLNELMEARIKITDENLKAIHKKELFMNMIYILIGFLYFLVAFIIYYI